MQRVIDEKFSALEEKDKELRQLRLAVRDRDHDLERLRCVLSANEATMQVRAKPSLLSPLPKPSRPEAAAPLSFSVTQNICSERETKLKTRGK